MMKSGHHKRSDSEDYYISLLRELEFNVEYDTVSNNADIKAIIAPGTLILLSFIGSE